MHAPLEPRPARGKDPRHASNSAGAGGNTGGQNTDGGGKGGNACGQGTCAAACTNPRHGGNGGTSAGDPLSLESIGTLLFREQDALDDVYRLSAMVDRNGNEIRLAYDGPELLTVTDSAGRVVRCVRDASRRIARFEVKTSTAPNGRRAFHRYEYDAAGDLVAVVDAGGRPTRFVYGEHLLVEQHLPDGLSVHHRHDRQGRCVETWGARGRWTYAYEARGLLRSVRDPAGHVAEFDHDAPYRRVEKRVRAGDGSTRRVQFVWDGEQLLHELTRGAPAGEAPARRCAGGASSTAWRPATRSAPPWRRCRTRTRPATWPSGRRRTGARGGVAPVTRGGRCGRRAGRAGDAGLLDVDRRAMDAAAPARQGLSDGGSSEGGWV